MPSGRWQVGDRIQNRYQICHVLGGPGKSGMGIVYVCYDHKFKEPVALKTFQDKFLPDLASIDRFKWEAELWVKLEKHHNIVWAKYVDEIEEQPYIHMEYIVGSEQYGVDLTGWIWGGGLTLPLTLNFAIQFCHGMIHASTKVKETGKSFVHRDVKPSNIMITRDRVVKITDFGLVKVFAESDDETPLMTLSEESHPSLGLSKSGNICGTPPYMSPEQCGGEKDTDVRSDIYSFGCVLYEMITRRYVFDARTPEEFINHHLKTIPKPPNVQKDLDRVIMKCLEKDPDRRYQDFSELEKILSKVYYGLTGDLVKLPETIQLEAWEEGNKGASLGYLGFHEQAIECYLRALKFEPNFAEVHSNLGLAYQALGKLDAAVEEHKEALRLDPNDALVHYNLGKAYHEQGSLDAALEEYKEALRLDPNDALAHYTIGLAYQAQGNLKEAIGCYQEFIRLAPPEHASLVKQTENSIRELNRKI